MKLHWFHSWEDIAFYGMAFPAIHQRCVKCGKERIWRPCP